MRYEIPPVLSGSAEEKLRQLWSFLFQLVERMNVGPEEGGKTVGDGEFSAKTAKDLREMIGTNAKTAAQLDKSKVSHSELVEELEEALRKAEQSGEFDGNGIAEASMDGEYRLTLEFTDGTSFTSPSLKGGLEYEIGDVFVTTREGEAAELLGYGTWELLASSPAYMWERIS